MADLHRNSFFTVTWRIENISMYTEKMDKDLKSPRFTVGTTEYQMFLTSGDWSTKTINVNILRSDLYLPLIDMDSEITLLGGDGRILESYKQVVVLYLKSRCNYLFPKPALFSNKKVLAMFLPQNTLTIRWKARHFGSGEHFFRTIFHKKIIRWEIKDFTKHFTFDNRFIVSSLQFSIHLSVLQRNLSTTLITVEMIPSDDIRLHFGNCTIAAVDGETVYLHGQVNLPYDKNLPSPCWKETVVITESVCNLIKNDNLILQCELIVGIGDFWNGREPPKKRKATSAPHSEDNIDSAATTQTSSNTLRGDLLHLYRGRNFCDVTLKTGDVSLPVHKIILCARSPVFLAMFKGDTEESRTGVVHVPDVEPDILARTLAFLYTNSLVDISWETASRLYDVAEKYSIQCLKEKCLSVLKDKLSVANACDALVLADIHHDEDLMQAVKEFVFDHDQVISSKEWEELEVNNPRLTTQLFHEMHLKKNK